MKRASLILLAFVALVAWATPAKAAILEGDLATFAVLGATPDVTNTGATTITGHIGVSPAASITGLDTITINGVNADTLAGSAFVHLSDATADAAQVQLTTLRTNLGLLGAGTLLPGNLTGLTLAPGIYTVPFAVSNLTGTLTLDGGGDANAFWLFQVTSSLITSTGSVVDVNNAGAGSGVFWNVGSSATLNTGSTFEGNILALTSITMGDAVTIECGRALANFGTVTMIGDTIDAVCAAEGNNGWSGSGLEFSGGNVVDSGGTVVSVPGSIVPEPGTFLIFGSLLAGLFGFRKRFLSAA